MLTLSLFSLDYLIILTVGYSSESSFSPCMNHWITGGGLEPKTMHRALYLRFSSILSVILISALNGLTDGCTQTTFTIVGSVFT